MVSFRRTHYPIASLRRFFARGAYRQEGPTGQRGLLASGRGFGPGGLPLGYAPGSSEIGFHEQKRCGIAVTDTNILKALPLPMPDGPSK